MAKWKEIGFDYSISGTSTVNWRLQSCRWIGWIVVCNSGYLDLYRKDLDLHFERLSYELELFFRD